MTCRHNAAAASIVMLAVLMPGLARATPRASPRILVSGDSYCPTAAAVAERLPALLRWTDANDGEVHRARIDHRDAGAHLRLEDPRGATIAERRLDSGASCGALAEAAAVVLATWQTTLQPGEVPSLLDRRSASSGSPEASPSPARMLYDVGAGVLLASTTSERALGAVADLHLAPSGGHFALHLGLRATQMSAIDVVERSARWQRPVIALGPAYVLRGAAWQWSSTFGGELGWFRVHGSDFPINHGGSRFSPGVVASTRVVRLLGAGLAPGLTAGGSLSLREHGLVVLGSGAQRSFRPGEFFLAISVSAGRFR